MSWTRPSFHLYLLQIDPKQAGGDVRVLKKKLTDKGITNIPHFGPLYYFEILQTLGYDRKAIAQSCPVCEEVFCKRFTHLPLYGLDQEQTGLYGRCCAGVRKGNAAGYMMTSPI